MTQSRTFPGNPKASTMPSSRVAIPIWEARGQALLSRHVSFYQLDHSKNDIKLLCESSSNISSFLSIDAEPRPVALQVGLRVT
jgi:hypothetical protein